MKGSVHVAGIGAITAIGNSVDECMRSFRQHTSGIGSITLFDSIHRGVLPVGEVKATNETLAANVGQPEYISRTALLGIQAAREAVASAGIDIAKWRTGLISATTVGGMDRTENFFPDFLQDNKKGKLHDVVNHACGRSTELIADDLGIHHFISTINTACSSSVNAIAYGTRLINHGMLDIVVAGGSDALSKFTLNGFNSLMILDREPCRPFDASRKGLNLGEGAGFVVIVSQRVLEQEKKKSLAVVAGYGNTNDAYHQTASSPEGRGSYAAMQKALAMSGLSLEAIDYINLHGTGTLNNDASEGTAVKRFFGEHLPKLSSTKAFTGHTLGASGGIEAVFSVLALTQQCVFPNLRFETAMPEVDIVPQQKFEETTVNHVMSNSFGFGGNCSSIIFSK
ncbi:MAG TPA: beta-ketoacyl-[acyl-carrier-protein] synthase family protein [Ohtaekwangia sp.]|uniref:beta-ketoacyl-[acyl-carrier-protein] synthase family protein n=1 Tax=Ohtaekwangia sp. TaxID=2066019 RepID=UPI002F9435BF